MSSNGSSIDSDNNVPHAARVSITPFDGDQMFQRWLLDRVHQRKEMFFERVPPLEPMIGFLTGMDDEFYSLSTSMFPVISHILPRHGITRIGETGRSLHELDQRVQVAIKRYTAKIHQACAETLIPTRRIPVPGPRTDRATQQSV